MTHLIDKQLLQSPPHHKTRYGASGKPSEATERFLIDPAYQTIIVRLNEATVGFLNYAIQDGGKVGFINMMGVFPEQSGQGLGKLLLHTSINQLRDQKVRSIYLFTDEDNKIARHLYEGAGFIAIHWRRWHNIRE